MTLYGYGRVSTTDQDLSVQEPSTVACCRFFGHADKILTMEPQSGYGKTEIQPRFQDRVGKAGEQAWRGPGTGFRKGLMLTLPGDPWLLIQETLDCGTFGSEADGAWLFRGATHRTL